MEIYIDPVFPVPRLLLLGSSPVNRALARLGKAMGYRVLAGGHSDADAAPEEADEIIASLDGLAALADRDAGAKVFVLVATMGESDEDMLAAALAARPDYIGVIASRRRMEEVEESLRARGADEDAIAAIDGPAGLDLGGTRPEEIALSVLAKIVSTRPQAATPGATTDSAPAPVSAARGSAGGKRTAPPGASSATTAVDPVCGMTVAADGSKPHAEHRGVTYHFCCSGCRDHFVADPDRFVEATLEATTDEGERT